MPITTQLYGIGCGHEGRLGSKGEENLSQPTLVRFFADNQKLVLRDVWAGGSHTMALTNEGLYAFGYNEDGALGVGQFGPVPKPAHIPNFAAEDIRAVALGGYHSLVLQQNGELYAFGANKAGQLGLGGEDNHKHPAKVPMLPDAFDVACGAQHSVAWTNEGIYTWGLGDCGQLGYTGDSWEVMIAKQNRIKKGVIEQARLRELAGGEVAVAAAPGEEAAAPLEPYNPAMHPARRKSSASTKEFFPPFSQRTPQKVPFDFPPVLGIHAGYNATAVRTVDGVYAFGARPGVFREDVTFTVPALVAPPPGHVIKEILLLRELRVALCAPEGDHDAHADHLTVWKQGESGAWVQYIPGAFPADTTIHGSERSVFVVTPSAEEPLVSFGDNFFGQLGHPTDADEEEEEEFAKPGPCLTLQMLRSKRTPPTVRKAAVGWRHALFLVAPPPQPAAVSEEP
eukprot:TRINITY_DN33045_c0_g1_i1.p1 TRINITY_DN33045_c0_g1~~TRINITY_DN33045_c0_g1_i1.p1  ORF type:complete len:454 (+),score=170.06 TRINITY_DN33045_c0_g1_i1:67-1428(+)